MLSFFIAQIDKSSIIQLRKPKNNDFHLSLHKDKGQDRIAQNNIIDDTAVDLYHCGGDDKDQDGGAFADEVANGTVCEMH